MKFHNPTLKKRFPFTPKKVKNCVTFCYLGCIRQFLNIDDPLLELKIDEMNTYY